jgi:hypothetical protein
MKYTAHPQGKQKNLPLIAIFDEDGERVAVLTMDDIAEHYRISIAILDKVFTEEKDE